MGKKQKCCIYNFVQCTYTHTYTLNKMDMQQTDRLFDGSSKISLGQDHHTNTLTNTIH